MFKCLILFEDINECKIERVCGENEECVNNKGLFLCNCKNGYYRNFLFEKCKGKVVNFLIVRMGIMEIFYLKNVKVK